MKLFVSIGNSRMEKRWNGVDMEMEEFIGRISNTVRTSETVEQYRKLSKAKQDDIKDVGGFVLGKLKGGRRKKDCVVFRSGLTLDMDYATEDIPEQMEMFFDFRCLIYSTHKHTPEKPRLRLIIPLCRTVTPDEYAAVARKVAEEIGMELFDDTTYEPSRLMYWPSTSADGEFVFRDIEGEILNPDMVLGKYQDWRDSSQWPVSSRQQAVVQREIRKQADPLGKEGVIGAFCRTYGIEEAVSTFLSDVYQSSAMLGRFDYIPADSQAGVVIYEGKFAYSHHATDPACGKLINAFDMVRIHKFGDLDVKSPEDVEAAKLPSFKAMSEFAVKDEKVKLTIAGERKEKAEKEFSDRNVDWLKQLEYEPRSTVLKNTLKNLLLILNNDEKLKGIVFNQLSDGMEIKEEVPWEHPSRFWRDADDAQLISYIDLAYGAFYARNYDIAVTKVADDRSYHPIREFLSSLPEWDKVPRVDTVLMEFLGASDNAYVRAVTRKTLCGAIARVMNPGCKFDTMLVLNGPQGKGKSTLISKLCGEWFNDSLLLNDTRDKTAAEKLQGYWILEIGELAGLKKTEIETLRGFLSRQNDIYRASFGRRAIPHPRQCIFIGTTNAENGYLRDTAGNRRFWPVKTPGDGKRASWEMTGEEIRQIWAEALVYYKAGEPLHLDNELAGMALREQQIAMEVDEREGMVRDYLDMLLPENWDRMELYDRRNYICGSEFGGTKEPGVRRRDRVCNMEIWCECFGKERGNLKRQDANEISAILANIEGWKKMDNKVRFSIYGVVRGYCRG
ncbi:virulence-associated E family protein [Robinsoniella peoriensis]|uniref:virulence-associated E family protein n=1 Tax=Robinsoniella peoriensis TaxID=180332 RepID=UPI0005C7E32F|nr:virulence-associated E family protein [Robinsoniella peoriensis]